MEFEQLRLIDQETFEQILSLDDEEFDFSKDLFFKYFDQGRDTLNNMHQKLQVLLNSRLEADLAELSKLGHFLKGSSGQLGLYRMQLVCKSVQDLGSIETDAWKITAKALLEQAEKTFNDSLNYIKYYYNK